MRWWQARRLRALALIAAVTIVAFATGCGSSTGAADPVEPQPSGDTTPGTAGPPNSAAPKSATGGPQLLVWVRFPGNENLPPTIELVESLPDPDRARENRGDAPNGSLWVVSRTADGDEIGRTWVERPDIDPTLATPTEALLRFETWWEVTSAAVPQFADGTTVVALLSGDEELDRFDHPPQ